MAKQPADQKQPARRRRGFERTSSLLAQRIRKASETRGFAETRLLTHWGEIVGADVAAVSRPVNVSYARGSFGATLTVLTTGAQAPMLQMQEPRLREKINACYGYSAITRIRFTQTAPTGFAEGQAEFGPAPVPEHRPPDREIKKQAEIMAVDVQDEGLRKALADLGAEVLRNSKKSAE
ncbi:hypothetical protein CLV78_11174 [Aliiruegeria haliotis]|uniref:RNA-binding protein n=1 Tax=Aliiruegeria haliotis TaxID=1280846 RepID=A0A2T0RIJ3_9RHOB|nr:DUF721 domain-containing protein [Aliiruegeria haliotis]PRY20920.1 hypothetical protein CLV78_11174 [Aliiruegeria haliotis]